MYTSLRITLQFIVPCVTVGIAYKGYAQTQGGILFWLRGNLRDRPAISPEIALINNEDNDRKCI